MLGGRQTLVGSGHLESESACPSTVADVFFFYIKEIHAACELQG